MEGAVADNGESQSEAGKWISRIEFDRSLEGFACHPGAELGQRGEPKNEVHTFEVWRKLNPLLSRFSRALAIAEHEPNLAEPRPSQRILRLELAGLQQGIASTLQIEVCLLRVG